MSHLRYRPEIDGLRAIAILPVVLYHAGVPAFHGGFVGVDVFFVISGFLITSIILTELDQGSFSLTKFYVRRIRRIFPALFFMLAACYPLAFLMLGPGEMKEFAGSVVSSALFYSNIYFWQQSGYFATAAELKPLLHTWSLAVEEQFYVVFPALAWLTAGLATRNRIWLFAAIAVASLGIAQYMVAGQSAAAFFMLHTRFWELLLGAIAALGLRTLPAQSIAGHGAAPYLSAVGLIGIGVAVTSFDANTPFPGVSALLPCLGATLVLVFASPRHWVGALLASRPMVFIGLISYSLYLWHYPLLAFVRHMTEKEDAALLGAACVAAVAMAAFSWRYVERPIREARGMAVRKAFGWAALGMLALSLLGVAGVATGGFQTFYVQYRLDASTRSNYERYHRFTERDHKAADNGDCVFAATTADPEFTARFESCARRYGKGLLIVGDSHSANIHNALASTGRFKFLATLWKGGCRPYDDKPACPYSSAAAFIAAHASSIAGVYFHVSGSHLLRDHTGREDRSAAFIEGNGTSIAEDHIHSIAAYLAGLPKSVPVYWLGPYAEARVNLEFPENFSPARLVFNRVSIDLFARLDAALKKASVGDGFRFISLVDALRFNENSLLQGECMTFSDEDHFSDCGERLFGPAIADSLTLPP